MDQKQVCTAVMRSLNDLRLSETFCDITLLVGDVPFPAHKTVLAGTSRFFQSIFSADESSGIFQINGMSSNDMMKILDFIYTGQIHITKSNVDSIDALAQQLQIDLLIQVCSEFRVPMVKGKTRETIASRGKVSNKRCRKGRTLGHSTCTDSEVMDSQDHFSSKDQAETFAVSVNEGNREQGQLLPSFLSEVPSAEAPVVSEANPEIDTRQSKTRGWLGPVINHDSMKTCSVKTHAPVLNPVISGILKGISSNSFRQAPVSQAACGTTNVFVLSDKIPCCRRENSFQMKETMHKECENGALDSDTLHWKEKLTSVESDGPDSEACVINMHEPPTVPSGGETSKNLVPDTSSECDLSSLLDIQNFLSNFPLQQPTVSQTTSPELKKCIPGTNTGGHLTLKKMGLLTQHETLLTNINFSRPDLALSTREEKMAHPQGKIIQIINSGDETSVGNKCTPSESAGFHNYCALSRQTSSLDCHTWSASKDTLVSDQIDAPPSPSPTPTSVTDYPIPMQAPKNAAIEGVNSDVNLTGEFRGDESAVLPTDSEWQDTHIMIIKHAPALGVCEETGPKNTCDKAKAKELPCTWCDDFFCKGASLNKHIKSAHPEKTLGCEFCERLFVDQDKLNSHVDWCRVKVKLNGRYHCPLCSYTAVKIYHVVDHYRTKHTTKMRRTCSQCNLAFTSLNCYYDHLLSAHEEQPDDLIRKKIHRCKECKFKTVKLYAFKTHRQQHLKHRHLCDICNKKFKSLEILKRHQNVVHGERLIKCRVCDFRSRYAATVKTHEYRRHRVFASDDQKVHYCHYCDYSNVNHAELKKHELNRHSDERPFLCSHCSKCFKHKHQLVIHERVHTGLRPFECNTCNYAGRTKGALVTHNRHRHSSLKFCVCDICGVRMKGNCKLWLHKVKCRKLALLKGHEGMITLDEGPSVSEPVTASF